MLLVPTGTPSETLATKAGSIVAFALPEGNKTTSAEIPINVTKGVLPGAEKIPTITPDAGKPASQGGGQQSQNVTAAGNTTASSGSSMKQ